MPSKFTNVTFDATGSLTLPDGTGSQRPTLTATVEQFTSTGADTWTCPAGVTSIELLVVGGGGSGGRGTTLAGWDGGGGAGGVIHIRDYPVIPGTIYNLSVGAGGTVPGSAANGDSGDNSIFDTVIAYGGGGGGKYGTAGSDGASGGGGGGDVYTFGGQGIVGQGNNGGSGQNLPPETGGGGGGAGEPGADGTVYGAGRGGDGLSINITGTSVYYGGGGGGGIGRNDLGGNTQVAKGGAGGGGNGGASGYTGGASSVAATNGEANTGGGGGGGNPSGNGGSGVVILRYVVDSDGDDPRGQIRFNSRTKTFEKYAQGTYKPKLNEDVITSGLIFAVDPSLYDGNGTIEDLTDPSYVGTVEQGAAFSTDGGGSFDFADDTDARVAFPDNNKMKFSTGDAVTCQVWAKTADIDFAEYQAIFTIGGDGNVSRDRMFQIRFRDVSIYEGVPDVVYRNAANDAWQIQYAASGASENEWVNITAQGIYGSTSALWNIFVNGEKVRTVVETGDFQADPIDSTTPVFIGIGEDGGGETLQGKVSQILVYNRYLSPEEIKKNYNATYKRYASKAVKSFKEPGIVKDSCRLYWDPSNINCYNPAHGTRVRPLIGNMRGAVNGTGGWSAEAGGVWIFDGSGDWIQTQYDSGRMFTEGVGAITVWFRTSSTNRQTIISGYSSGGTNRWDIEYASGVISGGFHDDGFLNGPTSINQNTWYCLCVNFKGGTQEFYLNGVLDNSKTTSRDLNAGDIGIGRRAGEDNFAFVGRMGAILMHNRPLTGAEVQQNFEAFRKRYGV